MAHSRNGAPARRPPESSTAERPLESADPPRDIESLEPAVEIIRPLLRDPELAPQAVARMATAVRMFSGPLPPPDVFKGYDDVVPGSAHEILEMARREQCHRHRMQFLEMLYPYLGWFAGFVCFLACVIGAVYLAMNNRLIVAGALLGVPCLGVISWFIHSRLSSTESPPTARAPAKRATKRHR
jgi:uncharacterized membrane protein